MSPKLKYIPDIGNIWADDTRKSLEIAESLMVLTGPSYTCKWRSFPPLTWWHQHACYSCAEARVKWPEAKRKMLRALTPAATPVLSELPATPLRDWVEEEIRSLNKKKAIAGVVTFKPLIPNRTTAEEVQRARAAGLHVEFYRETPRGFRDEV